MSVRDAHKFVSCLVREYKQDCKYVLGVTVITTLILLFYDYLESCANGGVVSW
jgi:hypothetical protein